MAERAKTVLMLMSGNGNLVPRMLAGVQGIARALRWEFFPVVCERGAGGTVVLQRSPGGDSIAELMRFLSPDGCIAATGDVPVAQLLDCARAARRGGVRLPVVYLNRAPDAPGGGNAGRVYGDSVQFAEIAARELLRSGYAHYAYAPWNDSDFWNRERAAAFRRFVALAGRTFHPFPRAFAYPDVGRLVEMLSPWLRALPKPVGVMAANDTVGEAVLRCCSRLGLEVPRDVAVCGVDDLTHICENTQPTLTSVRRDLEGEGRAAAEVLSEWMDRPSRPPPSRAVPAVSLVRRDSTRFSERRHWRVARAQEWIRLHACEPGVTVGAVVRQMGVARTTADRLFRAAAGRTILGEIHAIRIERAREKLRAGTPPEIVASACGYASYLDFRRVFRRLVGMPVVQWTKKV